MTSAAKNGMIGRWAKRVPPPASPPYRLFGARRNAGGEPAQGRVVEASRGTIMPQRPRPFPILTALAATLPAGAGPFALWGRTRTGRRSAGHAVTFAETGTRTELFHNTRPPRTHRRRVLKPATDG